MTCYSLEALIETLADRGSLDAVAEAHALECRRCRRRRRQALEILELVADPSLEPGLPASLHRSLAAIPEVRPERDHESIVAEASSVACDPVAIRGAVSALRERRLFRLGPYDLDLAFEEGAVVGRILPHAEGPVPGDWTGAWCILYGARGTRSCALDPGGGFDLEGCAPGRYDLAVEAQGRSLLLRNLHLPGEHPAP